MKKLILKNYEIPVVEIIRIEVEQGFACSSVLEDLEIGEEESM